MPLYDMKCPDCGHLEEVFCKIAERDQQKCLCGGTLGVVLGQAVAVHTFREGLYEHIAPEPIYISSKRQLRAECRERGVTMDYLE